MTDQAHALDLALKNATDALLAERNADGHWTGRLSSSALSTAVAAGALALAGGDQGNALAENAIGWLARHANADGGWGDTPDSPSNLSTTLLVWSAFNLCDAQKRHARVIDAAEAYLAHSAGSLTPAAIAGALDRRYGDDKTFSAPILAFCALAGRLGDGPGAWRFVKPLPFELAALPHRWLKWLRLPVVSYALPALIAVGLVRHRRLPSRNPLARLARRLAAGPALRKLADIQPESGGFLEAAPLTSFVASCLIAADLPNHPAVARSAEFLARTVRADGSWPIDTNLATWVTTLSINALSVDGQCTRMQADRAALRGWVLAQQHRQVHPYTHAAAGGWAWTDLSGGVPDADDTAEALLGLRNLAGKGDAETLRAATAGALWLCGIQNRDGGIPTFCRGWGKLPFDRSGADLTAHALRAWRAWRHDLPPAAQRRVERAVEKALRFLSAAQGRDGSWTPLWFGNQHAPDEANPTYGTARVVAALADCSLLPEQAARGAAWLIAARNADGGWGGGAGAPSSIEETALATEALVAAIRVLSADKAAQARAAAEGGAAWLIERTDGGRSFPAAPIGLYFARLWYAERLYPLIFTVSALGRVRAVGAAARAQGTEGGGLSVPPGGGV